VPAVLLLECAPVPMEEPVLVVAPVLVLLPVPEVAQAPVLVLLPVAQAALVEVLVLAAMTSALPQPDARGRLPHLAAAAPTLDRRCRGAQPPGRPCEQPQEAGQEQAPCVAPSLRPQSLAAPGGLLHVVAAVAAAVAPVPLLLPVMALLHQHPRHRRAVDTAVVRAAAQHLLQPAAPARASLPRHAW